MADIKDSSFSYITTAADTVVVPVLNPDGSSPTGFVNRNITKANLLKEDRARITTNETNIASNTARIVVVENLNTIRKDTSQTTNYNFQQTADSLIKMFAFLTVSGTPTVSVGTTLGGDDIVSSAAISGGKRFAEVIEHTTLTRTIYINISGGSVNLTTLSINNLF